jgi:hypothetical protein
MNRYLTEGWAVRQGPFLLWSYKLMPEDKVFIILMSETTKLKNSIANSIVQNPSWKVDCHLADQEIRVYYKIRKLVTL